MKHIPLTKGKFALVDDEDFEFLMQWKWRLSPHGYAIRNGYAPYIKGKRNIPMIIMHRVINKTPDGMETDHINSDRLDNRRCNLRSATGTQNRRNVMGNIGTSSQYKGVTWNKRSQKWMAQLVINKKHIHLGYFLSEKDAAIASNRAILMYHGEFARPNIL